MHVQNSTANQTGESDQAWLLLCFGGDFKYGKYLLLHLTAEQRNVLDGNLVDDHLNCTNPGGTDIFDRAATTENKGLHFNRAYLNYKFPGTPLSMEARYSLWQLDQAGYIGHNEPRFALFGDFDVMGAAVVKRESLRIGLQNDNDLIYCTFSAGYNLQPHREGARSGAQALAHMRQSVMHVFPPVQQEVLAAFLASLHVREQAQRGYQHSAGH